MAVWLTSQESQAWVEVVIKEDGEGCELERDGGSSLCDSRQRLSWMAI